MSDSAYQKYQHYGTAAERAAFTPNPPSTPTGTQPIYIWYETDTNNFYIYTTGWHGPFSASASAPVIKLSFTIDNSGSAISSTGLQKYFSFPCTGTINRVRVLANGNGNIVFDIWKTTWAGRPPTVANTITASAKPTLSAAQFYEDTTLTGWTKSVTAGDLGAINIDSVATITWAVLEIFIQPS